MILQLGDWFTVAVFGLLLDLTGRRRPSPADDRAVLARCFVGPLAAS
jgi:hypothetical protein